MQPNRELLFSLHQIPYLAYQAHYILSAPLTKAFSSAENAFPGAVAHPVSAAPAANEDNFRNSRLSISAFHYHPIEGWIHFFFRARKPTHFRSLRRWYQICLFRAMTKRFFLFSACAFFAPDQYTYPNSQFIISRQTFKLQLHKLIITTYRHSAMLILNHF